MIVIRYDHEIYDVASGAATYVVLGTESHHNIEEVFLPSKPSPGNPIFFTKKFVTHTEYRWEVIDTNVDLTAAQQTYVVVLKQRPQIEKEYYLQAILAARRNSAVHVLRPWSIVEVEFGHALNIGKTNGDIRSNKRYTDTMQRFSMPKRRLAVVNQVLSQRDDLIQVLPISSSQPQPHEKACVEVTADLTTMVNYQKRSWAVCRMMQTVTASRIIAPLIQRVPHAPEVRDKGFKSQIRGAVRDALKDAIMYGVEAGSRVADTHALVQAKSEAAQLSRQVTALTQKIAQLEQNAVIYERWAKDEKLTMLDLQDLYLDTK